MINQLMLSSLALIHQNNPFAVKPTIVPAMLQIESGYTDDTDHWHHVQIYIHDDSIYFRHSIWQNLNVRYDNLLRFHNINPIQWVAAFMQEIENHEIQSTSELERSVVAG